MENIIKKLNKLEAKLDILMLTLAEIALVIDNPNIIEDDEDDLNELDEEFHVNEAVTYTELDCQAETWLSFIVIIKEYIFESTEKTSLWGYWIELPNKDIIPVNKNTIKRF